MALPFANADGRVSPERLQSYLGAIKPEAMRAEMPAWRADPTDLLSLADFICTLGFKEHALMFYGFSLEAFARNPRLVAGDTNLSGGYYLFARTLLELGRAREAVGPLKTAASIDAHDASIWYLLGVAQTLSEAAADAVVSFERALRLEGLDRRAPATFFQEVRKSLARARELTTRSRAPESMNSDGSRCIVDLPGARKYLAERGIDFDGRRVLVPCQKADWREARACEICKVEEEGGSFSLLVVNLPYFFGENWRAESDGGPCLWEGGSIGDVVDLLDVRIASRMVNGVLPVP